MAKVNPKDLKPQVYKDPRPAEYFTRFHERARKGIGYIYNFVRVILTLPTILIYRARAIGHDNIPDEGAAIITPNHFSQMDHFFAAVYMRRRVQFMAKSQLFGNPLLNHIFYHGGVFPVRRGYDDQEAFKTAHTVLDRDGLLLMYAEGGRSRTGDLGEPKRGVGKIALESGAPVVPVAIHGSAAVRGWKRLIFPKVTIQFGEPLQFEQVAEPTKEQAQAASEIVFERVREMHSKLVGEGRKSAVRAAREARRRAAAALSPPASSVHERQH